VILVRIGVDRLDFFAAFEIASFGIAALVADERLFTRRGRP